MTHYPIPPPCCGVHRWLSKMCGWDRQSKSGPSSERPLQEGTTERMPGSREIQVGCKCVSPHPFLGFDNKSPLAPADLSFVVWIRLRRMQKLRRSGPSLQAINWLKFCYV